jgi:hypothetical protein
MGEYIADERRLGVNRAWAKGMGPGASVVSTGWSDQVRFLQLEGGGEGEIVQSSLNTSSEIWQPVVRI